MSRYSSRSLDLGSTRYDSSTSYKGLDPSSVGSYRSSNLTGYSSHGYSSRSDRTPYSSSSSSSTGVGSSSSRLHGSSYSSRSSSASDSVPLPRSSSFGRSEVLSGSTPRDQADRGSHSSSLGRSSSLSSHTEDSRSGRYSSRSSALTVDSTLDSGRDAAAERRLRLAERRRQREERGCSETSSDNSKEPSMERASSLRRDSDSDSLSNARARRLAARKLQELSVTEESENKESSPDAADTALRRSNRRLRGASGSSEDSTSADSAYVSGTRASLRQRRQLDSTDSSEAKASSSQSQDVQDADRSAHMNAEARRARRQRRLEGLEVAAGHQLVCENKAEGEEKNDSSAATSGSRSWRQRFQEEGISGVSASEAHDVKPQGQTSQDEENRAVHKDTENVQTQVRRRSQGSVSEEAGRRRSWLAQSRENSEEPSQVDTDAVATEVESRAERIARYKEERRKQLAHIANITSAPGSEEKEPEAMPSLFISAKRDKEDSPGDVTTQPDTAPDNGGGVTLMSRLRALRSGSDETDTVVTAQSEQSKSQVSTDTVIRGKNTSAASSDLTRKSSVRVSPESDSNLSNHHSVVSSQTSHPDVTSQTRKSSSSSSSALRQSPPPSDNKPSTITGTHSAASTTAASGRKPSTGSREPSPKKPVVSNENAKSDRKQLDGATDPRKCKSPSPVSSRLMAPTKSSAAKNTQSGTPSTTSPRASISPRSSPAPSDRHSVNRSASCKGPPRIKQPLLPEQTSKDSTGSQSSKSITSEEKDKINQQDNSGVQRKDRQSSRETSAPKLSSSSVGSSTFSTDRDSGIGSARLSSSSFSSARSLEKDTGTSRTAPVSKASRLQRTARVEVSSSSSREGSEEKQLIGQSSLKRTASLPSKTISGGNHLVSEENRSSHQKDRSLSSSSTSAKSQEVEEKQEHESLTKQTGAGTKSVESQNGGVSPTSAGLDDILAKNAEYLSSGEEAAGQKGRRRLRSGEEGKLRRSLRGKLHKSGSRSKSRDRQDSQGRESKDKGQTGEMEVEAKPIPTVTLPTTTTATLVHNTVTEGETITITPHDVRHTSDAQASSDVTTHTSTSVGNDAKGGKAEGSGEEESEGRGSKSKEATPDSDSVFHTASSAPSSCEVTRRRPQDKSSLRKSDLNKAPSPSGAANGTGEERGRKGDDEDCKRSTNISVRGSGFKYAALSNKVSAIRTRFSGEFANDKSKSSNGSKSTGVTRHPSRGKDFSQLLQKFSSSEASGSERSDSESSSQRRRVASFRRPADREVSSSSDDAHSARNTPERTQSLKVARPTLREAGKEEKGVERAGSFKSDFMKKRFSPVPHSDAASELSDVLSRRHKEIERQEQESTEQTAGIQTDAAQDSHLESLKTIDQSLAILERVTNELQEDSKSSEGTLLPKPTDQTPVSAKDRKESMEKAEQFVSDVQTRITESLHLADASIDQKIAKESFPSPVLSSPTTCFTVSLAPDETETKTLDSEKSSSDVQGRSEGDGTIADQSVVDGTSKLPPKVDDTETDSVTITVREDVKETLEKTSEQNTATQPSTSTKLATSVDVKPGLQSTGPAVNNSSTGLRRAESMKQPSSVSRSESFERRKGILKRSPSLPKQESRPTIDPQLHRIMEQRRLKELQTAREEDEDQEARRGSSRQRALSAAEEIEENIRHMREGHQNKPMPAEQSEEEAALYLSVSDRISKMQTKIEEEKFAPVTPKARSGATTPKSARSWSGSITPSKQMSMDESVIKEAPTKPTTIISSSSQVESVQAPAEEAVEEMVSGPQLMERLNTLAAKTADFQKRRHTFQKRPREDWRTRTQPVTLDEIHEADSLDTVSAFRALVRRNASKNVFDQLKSQDQHRPVPNKSSEFPQHLTPDKRGRRSRQERHKTLPVTAEELNAIPEGELLDNIPLRDGHELWTRDSRADSGILSGSDAESLGSDSLRSLTLDMDLSDNDPSRLSVSSKTSIFKNLDDRARQEREKEKSASGAKRYIDRKKRERSRTQPITDDEVKTAAEISDEKKSAPAVKIPQPEVVNRPKSPSVEQEEEPHEDDQLTKLSLAEKVKLFSQKQKEEQEAAQAKPPPRTEAPVPKRRQRKHNSRFNTQPVTPEELEKASKISPLAMSLVKPPDPELLMGLKLKDQQELMMMHAEATLTQCGSRPSSRASSQPGSRRGSFTTPDSLASADAIVDGESVSAVSEKEKTASSGKLNSASNSAKKQAVSSSHSELSRTDSEPRSILKKTKSVDSVHYYDNSLKPTPITDTTTNQSETSTARSESLSKSETTDDNIESEHASVNGRSSAVEDRSSHVDNRASPLNDRVSPANDRSSPDRSSPVADLILPTEASGEDVSTSSFYLADDDLGGESSTDPAVSEERGVGDRTAKTPDKRRSRAGDRKAQGDRYLTQPAPQLTPERSPQSKRKYEGRHMTQPITPDEMKEAEYCTTPVTKSSGGSIADRLAHCSLNQLKSSGEENWKRKVTKDKDLNTPVGEVKRREKSGLAAVRPSSISDRLSQLEVSAEQWKERVEDTDAKNFTVASKIPKTLVGFESPLVAKIRASSKKDLTRLDDSSNASSPVNSPSTPTKEFLPKVPLPKEIIVDPEAVKKAELKEKQKSEEKKAEEEEEPVHVEVPTMDETEIEDFFSTKDITEITDKVDLEIDDFDNIFIESNEILQSVRKIRPSRKKAATSRNPLKTVSQFVEIQTTYTQVNTGAAEKQLRKLKTEGLKRDAGFALEALAGLASKENFSKVELRKTEPSSLPASLSARRNPFVDLMLLHIKGRRNTQMRLVEPSSKSMNAGDCYILVTPDKVINWVGEFSNIIEKAKAAEVANYIQQKRDMGYKATAAVQTVNQVKDHLGAGKHFWAALQGEKECQACGPEEEDELYESSITKTNMIYRLEDGALKPYEQYWGAIPKHAMLNKKEVIVFDFGTEFYIWQGKEVSGSQRKQGMALAQKLWNKGYDYSECAVNPMAPLRSEEDGGIPAQDTKRPDWAIFGKVNQNMETILFREKFADWPDTSRLIGVRREKSIEIKCDFADIKAYDAKKMIPVNTSPVTLLLEGAHVGRGKKWQEDMQGFIKEQDIMTLGIKVWHVMEYEHFQMPEPSYGQFHRGDTYVVRWQYMITNAGLKSLKGQAARHSLTGRERCAYFFWQGQDSTINEKGASALMTVELDEERGPQVRVVQGKEPPCFLNLFEGGMVVHIGKREDASTNTEGPWRLYCLRGDEAGEVCLLEIPVCISNLRSCSSLVLLNTHTGITYIWHGVKSPQHKRQLAVEAVQNLKSKRPLELDLHSDAHIVVSEVEEGEEKADVWLALDSKDRSLYHSLLTEPGRYNYTPRLFHMTSVSMVFEVTEQMNPSRVPTVNTPFPFFQSDLYKASQPALFLVDVGQCVYLWQGWWPVGNEEVGNVHTGSAAARYNVDRRCAMETTLNYCKERGSGGKAPEAMLVCAGVEPLAFQNLFPFWDVDTTVQDLAIQDGKHEGYCEPVEDVYIKLTQTRYTLDELLERPLPDGVDPLKMESYLADQEFEEVLEMKRDEFYALPVWKQSQLKQSVGLF